MVEADVSEEIEENVSSEGWELFSGFGTLSQWWRFDLRYPSHILEETDSFLVNQILKITEKDILSMEQIIAVNLIHIYLLPLLNARGEFFSSTFEKFIL